MLTGPQINENEGRELISPANQVQSI